jgi:hypothetical protein
MAPSSTPASSTQDSGMSANFAETLASLFQQQQNSNNTPIPHVAPSAPMFDPLTFGTNTIILPVAYNQAIDQSLIQVIVFLRQYLSFDLIDGVKIY